MGSRRRQTATGLTYVSMCLPFLEQSAAYNQMSWVGRSPGYTGEATPSTGAQQPRAAMGATPPTVRPSFMKFGDQPRRELQLLCRDCRERLLR